MYVCVCIDYMAVGCVLAADTVQCPVHCPCWLIGRVCMYVCVCIDYMAVGCVLATDTGAVSSTLSLLAH